LCPILAWFLAKAFITRFNWNNVLAVIVSVIISFLLGGGMGFASVILMGVVAEAML
jgi:hypothetical protein